MRMEAPEQSWKKVLYDDQSVPDNYVDQSFLGQLRKNVNLVHFTFTEALYGVTGVVQQICRTVLFAVLFSHLQGGLLHPSDLFVGLALLGWPIYLLYAFAQKRKIDEVVEDLRRAAIFVAFGSSLAPIMGTLTETISTDTVYAMAAGALLLHVACHDYTPGSRMQGVCTTEAQEPASDDGPWAAISLNGALFGAVCLASRLTGSGPVLALSSLAVALFLLAPLLASWVQDRSPKLQVALTLIHGILALSSCWQLSPPLAAALALALLAVGLVLPGHFVYCHQYRQSIHGPWDEAVIDGQPH